MANGILSSLGVPQAGDPGMPPPDAPPVPPPSALDHPAAQAPMPADSGGFMGLAQQANAPPPPVAPSPSPAAAQPPQPSSPPDMQLAPPPPPTKPRPLTPQQQAGVNMVGAKAEDMLANGEINKQVIANDVSQLALDDAQKAHILKNLDMMDEHIKQVRTIGKQLAEDQGGKKYWENASAGDKVGRVLLGILTLGGSESYIKTSIARQVAADQKNLDTENNAYALMLERGKTAEQAAAIDYVKQSHQFVLGLDQIAAKHSHLTPDIQAKIAALKAGINKDQSVALLGMYKQQQENAVAKQNANTSTRRLDWEMNKPEKARLEQVKYDNETTFKKLDGTLGKARTPDEAKAINKNTNAFKTVQNSAMKIKAALTFGHSLGGEDHNTIENEAKAINAAVASMEDGGIKISNRNQELVQRFSNLNAMTGFDASRAHELDELLSGLRTDLANSYEQAAR